MIGLTLDTNGWAQVGELLAKASVHGTSITRLELAEIVDTNEKKRFDLAPSGDRIRANQGLSLPVDLALSPATPPEELFHGSAVQHRASILAQGLVRGARQHVHLSDESATARRVGSRHGSPIVFRVASGEMSRGNHLFFVSKNGVWLTNAVPAGYLREA